MRNFFILLVAFCFVGCASLGSITKTNQLSSGMTMEQVKSLLGHPSQTQFIQNKIVWKYELHQYFVGWVPYYLVFDKENQKLDAWYANEQEYYQNQKMLMNAANQMGQQNQTKQQLELQRQALEQERMNKIMEHQTQTIDTDCSTDSFGKVHCTSRQNAY